MDSVIMYAKCFPGLGETTGTGFDTSGIAIYQMVGTYGTDERMPSSIRDAFDSFCSRFAHIEDPVFFNFNEDMNQRRMTFQLNEKDMERRIVCTSRDGDYPKVVQRLEEVAQTRDIPFVKDSHPDNILDSWIGFLVHYRQMF